ncbi:hypothetical protein D3H65_28270 [Paraflavitalea soli]|uniref:Uncharacterized protein n=1 Tax=Paraflavitalea soli TaxID=2315862 RepID=A0A3B7MX52_9BACT|nr:hypothetical protein [Paraflavitalea soli]AXY77640.1 hypothetical protein D3H65_28270 [Paraflavitalea soli]
MRLTTKDHFWIWFKSNSEIYRKIGEMSKKEARYWLNELYAHLRSCGRNIHPYILFPKDESTRQLIISANGNLNYFEQVMELVSKAPVVPGWEIIGFYPPCAIDRRIKEGFGHTGIDPHNLWFKLYEEEDGQAHIVVFAEAFKPDDEVFVKAVEAVLMNVLGEYALRTELVGFEVDELENSIYEEEGECYKLQELPVQLERMRFSGLVVDAQGEIKQKR